MKETQPNSSSQRTDPQEQQDMQDHSASTETASHSKRSLIDLHDDDPCDDVTKWIGEMR